MTYKLSYNRGMDSTILAIRAVTSVYALQLIYPLLWIGIGVYAIVMIIIGWIASMASAWWWLLAIVPTFAITVGIAVWIIVYLLAKRLAPRMNRKQTAATKKFVKHIGRIAEHLGTPKFVLIFRVVKDVIARPASGRTFIGEITQEPGEMRRDFDELRSLF